MTVSPAMLKITSVTFCAHDERETHLRRCPTGKRWLIVNNIGLYLEYDNLQRAMGDLYAITGIDHENWTILGE